MFSIITIASSTTNPVEIVRAIERQVVQAVAEQVHRAEGADERQRHRDARDDRRGERPQEQEDHHHDQRDDEHQLELDVRDRARGSSSCGRSGSPSRPPTAATRCSCGSSALTRSTTAMMLAPGWRWMFTIDRRRRRSSTRPGGRSRRRRSTAATSESRTGRAVPIGDDDRRCTGRSTAAGRWRRSMYDCRGRRTSPWPGSRSTARSRVRTSSSVSPYDDERRRIRPERGRPASGRR